MAEILQGCAISFVLCCDCFFIFLSPFRMDFGSYNLYVSQLGLIGKPHGGRLKIHATVVQTIADKEGTPRSYQLILYYTRFNPGAACAFCIIDTLQSQREECFHTYCDNCLNKKIHSSFIIHSVYCPRCRDSKVTPPHFRHSNRVSRSSGCTWHVWNRAAVQITFCPNSFLYWFRASLYKEKYILKPIFTQIRSFFLHQICITFFWGVLNIHQQ